MTHDHALQAAAREAAEARRAIALDAAKKLDYAPLDRVNIIEDAIQIAVRASEARAMDEAHEHALTLDYAMHTWACANKQRLELEDANRGIDLQFEEIVSVTADLKLAEARAQKAEQESEGRLRELLRKAQEETEAWVRAEHAEAREHALLQEVAHLKIWAKHHEHGADFAPADARIVERAETALEAGEPLSQALAEDVCAIARAAIHTTLAAEARLPEGMKDCTILLRECEKGHGRLTAANWIDHGCDTCFNQKALRDIAAAERERDAAQQRMKESADLLEVAWGVIANAGGGDWAKETKMFQAAAAMWREDYFAFIAEPGPLVAAAPPESGKEPPASEEKR